MVWGLDPGNFETKEFQVPSIQTTRRSHQFVRVARGNAAPQASQVPGVVTYLNQTDEGYQEPAGSVRRAVPGSGSMS